MQWNPWILSAAIAGCFPILVQASEPVTARKEQPDELRVIDVRRQEGDPYRVFYEVSEKNGGGFIAPGKSLPVLKMVLLREGNENDGPHSGGDGTGGRGEILSRKGAPGFAPDAMKMEKGSYLGVSASAPPAVLRKQLNLPPGMGLVVDFVVPDGPAAHAGLERFDVLQKLDDQLLVNQQQLAVLVRSHKPGDEVKLGIIHDGKATTLSIKLIEHDLEPLAEEAEADEHVFYKYLPIPEPRLSKTVPPGPVSGWNKSSGGIVQSGPSSITWLENGKAYTVTTSRDGKKTLAVKEKDGQTSFEGPIDTAEQREKLPAELQAKLQHMNELLPGGPRGPRGARPVANDSDALARLLPGQPWLGFPDDGTTMELLSDPKYQSPLNRFADRQVPQTQPHKNRND